MSAVLTWDKPKRVMSKDEYQSRTADGAPPGVYESNMSTEDKLKWKAKLIEGCDRRVEVRKMFNNGVKGVFIFRFSDEVDVSMSFNGTADFTEQDLKDFLLVIQEARNVLGANDGD